MVPVREQQRENLNGFAETHVIGQTSPEPQRTQQMKPTKGFLVRS